MKSRHILLLALFSICSVICTSCYDEWGAHKNAEIRIIGSWQITHTYLNGVEIDSTDYYANMPGTYYYIYADYVLSVMTFHNGQYRYSTTGLWYLTDHNKNLVAEFSILGKNYSYTAYITKLSKRELFYEYDDLDGNHWRLELNSRSAY